jgi:hypothetical protein
MAWMTLSAAWDIALRSLVQVTELGRADVMPASFIKEAKGRQTGRFFYLPFSFYIKKCRTFFNLLYL